MDWLQFFSSVVQSLAWPVTVLLALYLVKNNLTAIFPYVEKLKYKDFEIELRQTKLELALTPAPTALPLPPAETLAQSSAEENLYRLAELSPRSAILEAWLQIEGAAAAAIANKMKATPGSMMAVPPLRLGEFLHKEGKLTDSQLSAFNRLRGLRNKAVHFSNSTFKLDEVSEYIGMASTLATQIRAAYAP